MSIGLLFQYLSACPNCNDQASPVIWRRVLSCSVCLGVAALCLSGICYSQAQEANANTTAQERYERALSFRLDLFHVLNQPNYQQLLKLDEDQVGLIQRLHRQMALEKREGIDAITSANNPDAEKVVRLRLRADNFRRDLIQLETCLTDQQQREVLSLLARKWGLKSLEHPWFAQEFNLTANDQSKLAKARYEVDQMLTDFLRGKSKPSPTERAALEKKATDVYVAVLGSRRFNRFSQLRRVGYRQIKRPESSPERTYASIIANRLSALDFLLHEELRATVELIDDQVSQLNEILEDRSAKRAEYLKQVTSSSPEKTKELLKQLATIEAAHEREVVEKIEDVLLPHQVDEAVRLMARKWGARAFGHPWIGSRVGISTKDQLTIDTELTHIAELSLKATRELDESLRKELQRELKELSIRVSQLIGEDSAKRYVELINR